MSYGCQTWALTQKLEDRLATTQNKMHRSMLGIKLDQRIRNKFIDNILKPKRVEKLVKELKFKWAGHLIRSDNKKWSKMSTEWVPYDRNRGKGRPYKRWRDEIVNKLGSINQWHNVARDRLAWKRVCENLF